METPNLGETQDNTFLGKECKQCHGKLRYRKNGACVPCAILRARQYREKHGHPYRGTTDRQKALRAGKIRYQGKPCLRGHSGIRWVSCCTCVECFTGEERRQYHRYKSAIQRADPVLGPLIRERDRARNQQWIAKNPERWRALQLHQKAIWKNTLLLMYPEANR